jgi:hypothetical protein
MHFMQGDVDLLEEMQWPVGQEVSARLLGADGATLDDGARFKVEVNGGVPVHIDESFDKHNPHHRQVHPAVPLVKPSSFITAVVADQGHMHRIDGGAVSANLLGECMHHDPRGSQSEQAGCWWWPSRCETKSGGSCEECERDHRQQRQAVL